VALLAAIAGLASACQVKTQTVERPSTAAVSSTTTVAPAVPSITFD
jgi:hypothetical protein